MLLIAASVLLAGALTAVSVTLATNGPKVGNSAPAARACIVTPQVVLQSAQLPGFVSFVAFPHAQLPGSHGLANHPLWMYTQFQCGIFYGFLAKIILTGKYRQQDDALARSLHYKLGKWPLVPFYGDVISERPHAVLEIYEDIYEFRSAKAASEWLQGRRYVPGGAHNLSVPGLPPGYVVRTGVAGPDDGKHEHEIGVNGQTGSLIIEMGFQGGKLLSWTDVNQLWNSAWARIQRTTQSRNLANRAAGSK
jgi:hypothetical protein